MSKLILTDSLHKKVLKIPLDYVNTYVEGDDNYVNS